MAKQKKRKAGRPPRTEKFTRVLITLRADLDAKAKRIGDGKRSRGIERAIEAMPESSLMVSQRQ